MALLTREELESLSHPRPGPCVSIYLPTERTGPEKRQNPIVLKNLVSEAEEQLKALGLRSLQLDPLLAPAHALVDNPSTWERPGNGMAVLLAPGFFREYHLPLPLKPLAFVGERFHLKPLLPAFLDHDSFFVLALSQHEVKLFHGTSHTVEEVDLGDTPRTLADALRYDTPEEQIRSHTAVRRSTGPGRGAQTWSGHADVSADQDRDLLTFFRQVDTGVRRAIGEQTVPLVLAGVEYEHALYRRANTYPHLAEQGVDGNSKLLSPHELHARALPAAQHVYEQRMQTERDRYQVLAATSQQASNDTKTIVPAAREGRVERLWVSRTAHAWGRFDPDTGEVHRCQRPEPGCEDLLDFAVSETLVHHGQVYVVDQERVPANSLAAAIFRY